MDDSTAHLVTYITAVVACLSALVGAWNFRRELLNQKITTAKWRKEYFSDLLKWSDEAMVLLSESFHLCELDPKRMGNNEYFERRHKLRVALSAHIDRGRWFFPNYITDQYGEQKHEAYQGYRHAVLDGLVQTYQEVTKRKAFLVKEIGEQGNLTDELKNSMCISGCKELEDISLEKIHRIKNSRF